MMKSGVRTKDGFSVQVRVLPNRQTIIYLAKMRTYKINKYEFVLIQYETKEGMKEIRFENCSAGVAIRTLVSSIKMPVILLKVNTSESSKFAPTIKVVNRCNSHAGFVDGKPGCIREYAHFDDTVREHLLEQKQKILNSN